MGVSVRECERERVCVGEWVDGPDLVEMCVCVYLCVCVCL